MTQSQVARGRWSQVARDTVTGDQDMVRGGQRDTVTGDQGDTVTGDQGHSHRWPGTRSQAAAQQLFPARGWGSNMRHPAAARAIPAQEKGLWSFKESLRVLQRQR